MELPYHWFGKTFARWQVVPIRQVARLGTGHTPSREKEEYWQNCTIPWVTVDDIRRHGEGSLCPLQETQQKISELGLANSAAVLHPPGTVMLSRTASIGFSCITGKPMATTQAFVTWTPNDSLIAGDYLHCAIKVMTQQYEYLAYGATHLTMYFPDIKTLRVPLPSIDEQRLIVRFLKSETAKIDALIAEQERLIGLLREKRQAVISHAVTKGLNPDVPMKQSGVEWLGDVPAHWQVLPLKRIVATPITDGPHETPQFLGAGVPFVSAEAISSGRIDFAKMRGFISAEDNARYSLKYAPRKYDIFMIKSGATTGVTAIVEGSTDFNIWSPLAVVRCGPEAHPHFVLAFMRSRNFQEAVQLNWSYGTQQNIGMGVIENLRCVVPPVEEQVKISEMLRKQNEAMEGLIGEAEGSIDLLQERRSALISAAVTGQIDVRGLAEQAAA